MRSRTSFFNRTLCFSAMRRFWPLWAAYLGIWVLSLPLPLLRQVQEDQLTSVDFLQGIYTLARAEGTVLGMIFSVFSAMAVWSFLYNARSAGGMACLPVRREGQFLSALLAGLLPLLGANLATALLTLPVCASMGCTPLILLEFFCIVSLIDLFFYGFAALCAQLTGHILVLPAVYGVLSFLAVGVELLCREVLSRFVYGVSSSFVGGLSSQWLSPPVGLIALTQVRVDYPAASAYAAELPREITVSFSGWTTLLLYAAAGLVCMALALLLFRRRRMESAGDVVAVAFLRPVFRWCMALGSGLLLASFVQLVMYDDGDAAAFLGLLIFFLLGGLIGWFAGEMLLKKSFRVFRKKAWGGFGLCCAVILALMLGMRFDLFGVERRVPRTEQIEYAQVYAGGYSAVLREPESLEQLTALHRAIVADKVLNQDHSYSKNGCTIIYHLRGGRQLVREYSLSYIYDDPARIGEAAALQELGNCREARLERGTADIPVTRENISYASLSVTMPVADCARAAGYADPEQFILCDVMGFSPEEAKRMGQAQRRELVGEALYFNGYYNEYGFSGWDNRSYTGPEDLEGVFFPGELRLSAGEAETLYADCLLPDLEDGTLGQVWLFPSQEERNTVYDAHVTIYLIENRLRETDGYGLSRQELTFTPTIYSQRTNAWMEARGITLHTPAELEGRMG